MIKSKDIKPLGKFVAIEMQVTKSSESQGGIILGSETESRKLVIRALGPDCTIDPANIGAEVVANINSQFMLLDPEADTKLFVGPEALIMAVIR